MSFKVGLFADSFPPIIDGVSNAVYCYARIIKERYGDCVVATPKNKIDNDSFSFPVVRYDSIPLHVPHKNLPYRAGNPYDTKTIRQLTSEKLDIIHAHSPFTSAILAKMVGRGRVPIVSTYHTKYEIDFADLIESKLFRQIALDFVVTNMSAADEVWTVSNGAGLALRKIGYKGDYRIMENGTDFARGTAPQPEVEKLYAKYGIESDELVFLYVGRMMWYKNIRITLDALRLLRGRGIKFRMFFIGDGYDAPSIKQYAEDNGLGDVCEFVGSVRDRELLRTYYSMSDMFLFPSTFDTSGLVVKEAAACDCPALLVRGSCACEGVTDDFTGFLADENPYSCSMRILSAVQDREHMRQVGANAGQHIYLSWDDAVAKAYNRYGEILEQWKGKPQKRVHATMREANRSFSAGRR